MTKNKFIHNYSLCEGCTVKEHAANLLLATAESVVLRGISRLTRIHSIFEDCSLTVHVIYFLHNFWFREMNMYGS